MRHTTAKVLTVAATTTALLTAVAAGPAAANPAPEPASASALTLTAVLPAAQDVVGAGAPGTEAVYGRFSADYNLTPGPVGGQPELYGLSASGPSPVVPKTGGTPIVRPASSSAGIAALNATTSTTLDYARSVRGRLAGDPTGVLFGAFAKDAVTWAAKSGGHAPANLTAQNLFDIYSCLPGATNWASLGGAAGTVKPYLPQAGSETRAAFLKAIGDPVLGGCVLVGPAEDEGTDPVLNDPDVLFPYSAGHWVGQANGHSTATDDKGPLTLRSVNGVAPLTGTGTLNPAFAGAPFGRVLYTVVRSGDWTASSPRSTALHAVFGPSGWVCSTAGRADTASYGYLTVPATICGSFG
ncbi:hypothetical protein [Kitasatospora sp. NPDC088134]|uniref:hypothetical protein n=1 Tax=Kitasatospora sp. NPDC088134 TaxID=3364071 RepID=UPI003824763E